MPRMPPGASWHDTISSQPQDGQLVLMRRSPGDCPPLAANWDARNAQFLCGPEGWVIPWQFVSHWRGLDCAPGLSRVLGRRSGRTSTFVHPGMGSWSGCAGEVSRVPLFGRASTGRGSRLRFRLAGASSGMRRGSGEPVELNSRRRASAHESLRQRPGIEHCGSRALAFGSNSLR
jgi:hypothetical protein